jgi:hypothetical protein
MKTLVTKAKQDSFVSFRTKVLGDINNQKGNEYIEKLKKQFKIK